VIHVLVEILTSQARFRRANELELRFHIDELTDENIAAGMPPDEARRRAILEFGGQEKIKEEVRDVYRIRLLDATVANLKSAFRFIRKSPTFSATVILTLALGIGANSAVFSAIDAILLKPLPFPTPISLCASTNTIRKLQAHSIGCSGPSRGLESPQFHLPGAHRLLQRRCFRVHRPSAGKGNSRLVSPRFFKSGPFRPCWAVNSRPTRRLSTGRPRPD